MAVRGGHAQECRGRLGIDRSLAGEPLHSCKCWVFGIGWPSFAGVKATHFSRLIFLRKKVFVVDAIL